MFPFGIISTNFWANFMKYFLPVSQALFLSYCFETSHSLLPIIDLPPKNVFWFFGISLHACTEHTFSANLSWMSPYLQQVGSCTTFPLVLPFIVKKNFLPFSNYSLICSDLSVTDNREGEVRSRGALNSCIYFSETRTVGKIEEYGTALQ